MNLFIIRNVYYLNLSLPNSVQCTDFKFLALIHRKFVDVFKDT